MNFKAHLENSEGMLKLQDEWDEDCPAINPVTYWFARNIVEQAWMKLALNCHGASLGAHPYLSPGGEASVIIYLKTVLGSLYAECYLDVEEKPYIEYSYRVTGHNFTTKAQGEFSDPGHAVSIFLSGI